MTNAQTAEAWLRSALSAPAPKAARSIAQALSQKYPGAAVFLYGSGISVSGNENPTDILYDFYVIVPDYRQAIAGFAERWAARFLPPNVYYFELDAPDGVLRSKYALLSVAHFERLTGDRTFHSYFWARFAQPSRLVVSPPDIESRLLAAVRRSIETFLRRSQGLAENPDDWRSVWLAGLNASYRAELRAEAEGRAQKLIDSYGDWPKTVASFGLDPAAKHSRRIKFAWRMRALAGGGLSIARLLKASATFRGGVDYIAWKVKRHTGIDVGVKPWERRHPFIAAPIVAFRYYRMRALRRQSFESC